MFVGSAVGSSAFIKLPGDVQLLPAKDSSCEPITSCSLPWEVMPWDDAGLDSCAPVHDAALIPSPSGCGDQEILMTCGVESSGRVALARWAARLAPLVSGGPQLPVSCLLFWEHSATRQVKAYQCFVVVRLTHSGAAC